MPARAAVRPREPADGPCTSPPRRRPDPRVATPWADRERARCRAGRALPALRRADVRARACTRARVTRWALPRPMDHLLTTYHISTPTRPLSHETCGPHCPSPVPAFKSALGRLRFPKCRHDNRSPTAAAAADTAPPPRTTTDPIHPHYRHRPTHQHPPTPPAPCPSNTSGTHGQRPGSIPGR